MTKPVDLTPKFSIISAEDEILIPEASDLSQLVGEQYLKNPTTLRSSITLEKTGHIKGGQTAYETGVGFFLGYSSSAYKFSIGNTTDYLKWDGTNLSMLSSNANAITIDYGSDILLKEGGDIKFTSVENGDGLDMALSQIIEIAGNVDIGEHRYQVTFVNEAGETALTQGSYTTITTDSTHKQVGLVDIPVSSSGSVTARKIYRTKAGDTAKYYLLTTISDNTTTTYTDNTADSSLTGGDAYTKENNSFGKLFVDSVASLSLGVTNSLVGQGSGAAITTGFKNIALGSNSLKANTTGYRNIAIGFEALRWNTAGFGNVAIGSGDTEGALATNTGDSNTAIGYEALKSNSSPSENTALGYKALRLTDSGDGNIGIGAYAGSRFSGSDSFFVNNRDRTNEAGDKTKSLIYGYMQDDPEDQWLKINGHLRQSNYDSITAYAGGGQANATVIDGGIVEIGTCASAGDSVALPFAAVTDKKGIQIIITNHGANSCDVFPSTDTDQNDSINGSANAKALAVNASMLCVCYDDYDWECLTLAR